MTDAVIIQDGEFKRVAGQVRDANDLQASASLITLVKGCADVLERHYGGWLWAVRPDERGGIIDIFCMRISSKFAYTLHTPKLHEDPTFARVMRAGGEFLERFGFRRVPYSSEEWHRRELIMGQFIPDITDMDVMLQRNARTRIVRQAMQTGHAKVAINQSIGEALRARNAGALH